MSRTLLAVLTLCAAPAALAAQQLERPAGWRVVTAEPLPDSAMTFVAMPPGWHVTTGPAALLFDPAFTARGVFTLETEIFLFPGTSQEGYGLFVGGSALGEPGASAVAILLRRDGAVSVVRREGGAERLLIPWSVQPAVRAQEGGDAVRNVLRVAVDPDEVVVRANGLEVARLPRAGLPLDGAFGFSVGRDVNVHVSRLDLTTRLAPPRR